MVAHSSNFCEMHLRVLMLNYLVEDHRWHACWFNYCIPKLTEYHNWMSLQVVLSSEQ